MVFYIMYTHASFNFDAATSIKKKKLAIQNKIKKVFPYSPKDMVFYFIFTHQLVLILIQEQDFFFKLTTQFLLKKSCSFIIQKIMVV